MNVRWSKVCSGADAFGYFIDASTELYLLAFEEDLRPVFSDRELLYLTDAMAERGIRLRRSLGELLEGANVSDGEQKREGDASDDGGDSELEYNSRELRRLMPY